MKNLENIKCEIEDMIGESLNNIFLHFQKQLNITSGDCNWEYTYDLDRKTEELAKLVVDVLKSQSESDYDSVLCGFVWSHGDKDLSAWQVDLSEEDAATIEGILEKYTDKGCSVRNCYDSKFSEVF